MAEKKKLNYFEELNNINVQDKIEKKAIYLIYLGRLRGSS